jgi:hypothetical protein
VAVFAANALDPGEVTVRVHEPGVAGAMRVLAMTTQPPAAAMLSGEPDCDEAATAIRAFGAIVMVPPDVHGPWPAGPAEIGSRVSAGSTATVCWALPLALLFVALKLAVMTWLPSAVGVHGTVAAPLLTGTEPEMLETVPFTFRSMAADPVSVLLFTTAAIDVGCPSR